MQATLRYLFRALRYRLRVDPAELRFVRQHLRPGGVAVDIGCHKGAYTYWMQRWVGAVGEVIAFEPQPRQIAYLNDLFAAMCYTNVILVPMGVSDVSGHLQLHVPQARGASHEASFAAMKAERQACESFDVNVTTLDEFFATRQRGPDFLKIDVEGHELAVLTGGRQTLTTHRPPLLVECEARHHHDGDIRPVLDQLLSWGYLGSFFQNGQRHPIASFRPLEHQPTIDKEQKPPPGYVNNFAFEHPARI